MRQTIHSHNLFRLFNPRGVAIIGASRTPGKIGHSLLLNIKLGNFRGGVFPVNPNVDRILGYQVYKSVTQIPENKEIDIGIVSLPAKSVEDSVIACGKRGIKFLVIISSGFSEIGEISLEKKIVNRASEFGMRILGPNIFGIYSAPVCLNATFGPSEIIPGNIALITQSGALGVALLGRMVVERIGLSSIISVGNKADLDDVDIIDYLSHDDSTTAILIYMEGTSRGRELARIGNEVIKRKPVIIIKAGKTKSGARAAVSHTGALAGYDRIFDAALKQAGILRAQSIQEAFNWLRTLSTQPPCTVNEEVVIITNGGGVGVMAADACEMADIELYEDIDVLESTFKHSIPTFGSSKNPIDITGQGGEETYEKILKSALQEKKIPGIVGLFCETATSDWESMARMIYNSLENTEAKKPTVFSLIGGEKSRQAITMLNNRGIPAYSYPEEAVSSLGAFFSWLRYKNRTGKPLLDLSLSSKEVSSIKKFFGKIRKDCKRNQLLETEAKEVLSMIGILTPESKLAVNLKQAKIAADTTGFPVAMKIVSPDIIHKTEAGGVKLGIRNQKELESSYKSILSNCRSKYPKAKITGISVSKMVEKGIETIVGGMTDPGFGPVIMFGLGGIYVEILKDVVFRIAPISKQESRNMITEISAFQLLLGARGAKISDLDTLTTVIHKVSVLFASMPEILEFDINPLLVLEKGKGCYALDARITLSTNSESADYIK